MPDEPVPDDAAGLRAANARLRAVVEAKDGQVAMLTAALDAALERERRLGLRLAEVERRLGWTVRAAKCKQPDRLTSDPHRPDMTF